MLTPPRAQIVDGKIDIDSLRKPKGYMTESS
jgi:hypothetical protein